MHTHITLDGISLQIPVQLLSGGTRDSVFPLSSQGMLLILGRHLKKQGSGYRFSILIALWNHLGASTAYLYSVSDTIGLGWGPDMTYIYTDFTFTFHFHALKKDMATQTVFLPGEPQGRGSLVGCRRTESDATEVT